MLEALKLQRFNQHCSVSSGTEPKSPPRVPCAWPPQFSRETHIGACRQTHYKSGFAVSAQGFTFRKLKLNAIQLLRSEQVCKRQASNNCRLLLWHFARGPSVVPMCSNHAPEIPKPLIKVELSSVRGDENCHTSSAPKCVLGHSLTLHARCMSRAFSSSAAARRRACLRTKGAFLRGMSVHTKPQA